MNRTRRFLLVLVPLVVLTLPAGSAQAAPFTPELAADYTAALEWWGVFSPPQCSSVTQELVPSDPYASGGIEATMRATQPEPGTVVPCTIWAMEDELAPLSGCERAVVMRHEVGHLLGYPHSPYPGNVMYGGGRLAFSKWCREDLAKEGWPVWREYKAECQYWAGTKREKRCHAEMRHYRLNLIAKLRRLTAETVGR